MKKTLKTTGTVVYAITAVLYLVTLFLNYESVSRNLDGFHSLSSEHAIAFAILCLILVVFCVYIIISLTRNKGNAINYILGLILLLLPFVFLLINVNLPGNIETAIQGLILRICQGFESTYLYLIIASFIGYICLLSQKLIKI